MMKGFENLGFYDESLLEIVALLFSFDFELVLLGPIKRKGKERKLNCHFSLQKLESCSFECATICSYLFSWGERGASVRQWKGI